MAALRFRLRLDVGEMCFPSIYEPYSVPGSDMPRKYGCSFPFSLLDHEQREDIEPREQRGGGPALTHCSTKWRPRVGLFDPATDRVLTDRRRLLELHDEMVMRDVENRPRESLFRELPMMIEVERLRYDHPMRCGTMLVLHQVWAGLS